MKSYAADDFKFIHEARGKLLQEEMKPAADNTALGPRRLNSDLQLIGGCEECQRNNASCTTKCYR